MNDTLAICLDTLDSNGFADEAVWDESHQEYAALIVLTEPVTFTLDDHMGHAELGVRVDIKPARVVSIDPDAYVLSQDIDGNITAVGGVTPKQWQRWREQLDCECADCDRR